MAMPDRILMLKLLGDTSSIDKSLRGTSSRMKSLARGASMWGKAFTTALVFEGIDKVTDALGEAWTGFREGEKAAAQLGTTWKNLGLDGSKLQGTIDAISASTLKLGTDDTEAINAFNEALQNTGGDSAAAMKRLKIAQDLVANGAAPNLASALKLILQAAKGSARVVDRFGLTADTAGGRVKELGKKVRGAAKAKADLDPLGVLFNALNEDLEGIIGSLASGDLEGGMKSFAKMGDDVATAWGKIDTAATPTLDKLTGGAFSGLREDLGGILDKFAPLQGFFDKVGPAIDQMATAFGKAQPTLQAAGDALSPLLSIPIEGLTGLFSMPFDTGKGILGALNALATGDLPGALDSLSTMISDLMGDIDQMFLGLPGKFVEWAGPIAEGALGIGSGIFEGVLEGVRKIPGAIGDLAQDAVNRFISFWNSLDFRIPPFVLPAIDIGFPSTGNGDLDKLLPRIKGGPWTIWSGTGDLIPDIGGGRDTPLQHGMHKKGLWEVPGDGYPAILHRGEMVMPSDFADQYRRNGGGGGGGNNYTIHVNVEAGADLAEAGRRMVKAIQSYERIDGKVWRTA